MVILRNPYVLYNVMSIHRLLYHRPSWRSVTNFASRLDCRHTRRSYLVIQSSEEHQSHNPFSHIRVVGREPMDFGSDSDVFEQTAPIQHRANELFCFEPKDDQVEAIQHLLCDRNQILIVETGFIIFQTAPDPSSRKSRLSRSMRA